jgi:hypothetical protein
MLFLPREHAFFIVLHEPTVARHIGGKDGGKAAFHEVSRGEERG